MIGKLELVTNSNTSLQPFVIDSTPSTPNIIFNPKEGILEIRGRSVPEDGGSFYAPLIDTISKNSHTILFPLQVSIHLECFNNSSSKYLLYIFRLLEIVSLLGNKVTVNWYYEKDNEIYKAGMDYKSLAKFPFNVKKKNIAIEL